MTAYQLELKEFIEDKILSEGGVRKLSNKVGLDPSALLKMRSGNWHPKLKTVRKYFPDFAPTTHDDYNVVRNVIEVNCKDLDDMKEQLDKLGYEIRIIPKRA